MHSADRPSAEFGRRTWRIFSARGGLPFASTALRNFRFPFRGWRRAVVRAGKLQGSGQAHLISDGGLGWPLPGRECPRAVEVCWARHTAQVNRTDRLYAIVEELRAANPGYRTAQELASIYEVSTRTIERDVLALQEAGVPITGVTGRRGGYCIDPARTLPPMNFTPTEAIAIAMALQDNPGPFAASGRTARNKILAAMSADDREATRDVADRVRRFRRQQRAEGSGVSMVLQQAIAEQLVVEFDYTDRHDASSRREVEPIGVVSLDEAWFLVGWCRLRHGARSFRADRITNAMLTGEKAEERDPAQFIECIPWALESPGLFH